MTVSPGLRCGYADGGRFCFLPDVVSVVVFCGAGGFESPVRSWAVNSVGYEAESSVLRETDDVVLLCRLNLLMFSPTASPSSSATDSSRGRSHQFRDLNEESLNTHLRSIPRFRLPPKIYPCPLLRFLRHCLPDPLLFHRLRAVHTHCRMFPNS